MVEGGRIFLNFGNHLDIRNKVLVNNKIDL